MTPNSKVPSPNRITFQFAVPKTNSQPTNATKHGALSRPGGQVAILWSIAGSGAEARFKFHWRERGGPPVVAPTHQGFGSVVLERLVVAEFGVSPKVIFASEGLIYEMEAPLSGIIAGAGQA